ncbi:MAG: hypothetical protein ACH0QD_04155 [Tepidibacillus sp.]
MDSKKILLPASILKKHFNVTIVIDKGAKRAVNIVSKENLVDEEG